MSISAGGHGHVLTASAHDADSDPMPAPASRRRKHLVFLGLNSDAINRAIEDGVKYWPRTAWLWSSKTGTSVSRCASTAATGPMSARSVATIIAVATTGARVARPSQ